MSSVFFFTVIEVNAGLQTATMWGSDDERMFLRVEGHLDLCASDPPELTQITVTNFH